jgi:hypothetical protein
MAGPSRSKNGVASLAHSRSKNGVASLAHSRSKNGVASLAYGPGHPRLKARDALKTWMPGIKPA